MVKSTKSEKFTLLSNSPAVMMISCNLSNPTSEKIGFVHHALIERYLATTLINTSNSTSVKNGWISFAISSSVAFWTNCWALYKAFVNFSNTYLLLLKYLMDVEYAV